MSTRFDTHNKFGDQPGEGWFILEGKQAGHRTLETQLEGLEPILAEAKDASVLDLGAAEGLIGAKFAERGAAEVDCVEIDPARIRKMEEWIQDEAVKGHQMDLNDFIQTHSQYPNPLRMNYDITLVLAIAHKLKEPERFIRYTATITKKLYALKTPKRDIQDRRSGNRLIKPHRILGEEFELVKEGPNSIGEHLAIYRRRGD